MAINFFNFSNFCMNVLSSKHHGALCKCTKKFQKWHVFPCFHQIPKLERATLNAHKKLNWLYNEQDLEINVNGERKKRPNVVQCT